MVIYYRNGSQSFAANVLNQYSAIDGTRQPTYDDSGNMVNNGLNKTFSYDSENRLISATMGSTSSVEYDYDPFGRRVIKDHDDEGAPIVTRYVYDGPHCIAEYNGAGTLLRKYVYGPGIDEALMMINVSGQTQTKYYYHRDALGNVMALSNAANYIVEGYTYSAFGIATVNRSPGGDDDWLTPDGATSVISAFGNPYMFTGRRYDWETGLYYYRARYYDATLGRFISADPISYAGGMNLYAYVKNNPVNAIDPTGTISKWLGCIACGAALGGEALGYLIGCGIGCAGGPDGCFSTCVKEAFGGPILFLLPQNVQEAIGSAACLACIGEVLHELAPGSGGPPCDYEYNPDPPKMPKFPQPEETPVPIRKAA